MVDGVRIIDCTFVNNFRTIFDGAFVDLGNWGDYDVEDLPKTKNIEIINCGFENVPMWRRLIARRIYAETPKVDGQGWIFRIPSIFVKAFWAFRRFQSAK